MVKTQERMIKVLGKVLYLATVGNPGDDIYVAKFRRTTTRENGEADNFWDILPGFVSYGADIDLSKEKTPDDSRLIKMLEPYIIVAMDNGIRWQEV